jgi:hypothetical protein
MISIEVTEDVYCELKQPLNELKFSISRKSNWDRGHELVTLFFSSASVGIITIICNTIYKIKALNSIKIKIHGYEIEFNERNLDSVQAMISHIEKVKQKIEDTKP